MANTSRRLYVLLAAVILIGVPVTPQLFDGIDESDDFTFGVDLGMLDMDMSDLQDSMGSFEIASGSSDKLDIMPVPNADLWEKIRNLKKRLDTLEFLATTVETNITASKEAVNTYTPSSQNTATQTVDLSGFATKSELSSLVNSVTQHISKVQQMTADWDDTSKRTSGELLLQFPI
ncbi:uncharacterized protein LOC121381623 [Gigantopelta aegis]|uniref:uncharacterized protein LOC121381623 n=1 Tax=Gigantopelta aegis TaxID=1735272 RepID=UPI001B88B6CD|nr:uncharacterized protein LOC121381623 [Gigantopelta aegis]